MNRGLALLLLLCLLAGSAPCAPLTGDEKRLLSQSISAATAEEFGRTGDAEGLERIVALGDADLVNAFGRGMQVASIDLAPAVEAVVIRHFDHPRIGAALRAMPARYRTRALFDLHFARIANAYQANEPSIGQVMNTLQPGVDEELLKLSPKMPKSGGIDVFTAFALQRRNPVVVPVLLDALAESFADQKNFGWNPVFDGLLTYPSEDVWQRTAREIDRLDREGRLTPQQYTAARAKLDPLLKDPAAKLEWMRPRYALDELRARTSLIPTNLGHIERLRTSDPPAYVREQEAYLLEQEKIAREMQALPILRPFLSHPRFALALYARFRARDPAAAARLFAAAADLGNELALVALADTHQFELQDVRAAVDAYRRAFAEASNPRRNDAQSPFGSQGGRVNAFWKAWLSQEIAFLETGHVFRGFIGEAEIGGFFEAMLEKTVYVTGIFAPQFEVPNTRVVKYTTRGQVLGPTWSADAEQLRRIRARPGLRERLDALPTSRLALMMGIRHASTLDDADAILAYFARNDPSGYWSACAFGTVYRLDHMGPEWKDEAVRNESAELLPGLTAPEAPRPLSVAAQRFMESRGLRAVPVGAAVKP